MNFKEQLKAIKNYTREDCTKIHDFMIDSENLHIEQCIRTGYRHQRLTQYTDEQLEILSEAMTDRIMELY